MSSLCSVLSFEVLGTLEISTPPKDAAEAEAEAEAEKEKEKVKEEHTFLNNIYKSVLLSLRSRQSRLLMRDCT